MPDIKKIQEVSGKTDSFLARTQKKNRVLIAKSIKKLEKDMIDIVKRLETSPKGARVESLKINLKQSQEAHKDMIRIVEGEYNSKIRGMVKGFDKISEHIEKSYSSLGEAAKFSGVNKEMIDTLKDETYEQFKQFGVEARDKVNNAMYDTIISKGKFSDLVETIRGVLSPHKDIKGRSMSMYADQYAFDSVMNFHNKVNIAKADDLGMKHFLYMGDIMATTRDFCSARAGRMYSKEEIESWTFSWTGKAGPAMTYRGGYRCRHHWRPIRKKWMGGRDRVDVGRYPVPEKKKRKKAKVKGVAGEIQKCSACRERKKPSIKGVAGNLPRCSGMKDPSIKGVAGNIPLC